jgi:hypothetical protein
MKVEILFSLLLLSQSCLRFEFISDQLVFVAKQRGLRSVKNLVYILPSVAQAFVTI